MLDRRPFQKTAKTIQLRDFLNTIELGHVVPYEKFEAMGHYIQQSKGRSHMETACKDLRENDGIFFICIHKVGYQRVSDEEYAKIELEKTRKRISNLSRRAEKKVLCVNMEELSNETRKAVLTGLTQFSVIHQFASDKARKVIESHIVPENGKMTVGKTLALFAGN